MRDFGEQIEKSPYKGLQSSPLLVRLQSAVLGVGSAVCSLGRSVSAAAPVFRVARQVERLDWPLGSARLDSAGVGSTRLFALN